MYELNLAISPEEFLVKISQPTFNEKILYIKEEWEGTQLNLEGVLSFPFQQIPNMVPFLNKKDTYYILCAQGNRSTYASTYLNYVGFERIYTVETGIEGLKELLKREQLNLTWIS